MSEENVELVRSVYADPLRLTAGASGKVAVDAEFDFTEPCRGPRSRRLSE